MPPRIFPAIGRHHARLLRNQLERYAQRLQELDFLLSREDIMGDMKQYRAISREHADVTAIASRYTRYQQTEADVSAAREMLNDPDMVEMAQEEIAGGEQELLKLEAELQRLLLPRTPMTLVPPSWKSAPAQAATNPRCLPAI